MKGNNLKSVGEYFARTRGCVVNGPVLTKVMWGVGLEDFSVKVQKRKSVDL
ncbi:hypothetical protein MNL02_06570 [Bartonella krasnovii]|uniref:hypothetical protein n=1 Tax=Bartonella krasnovii TaxID=2267275 RepID=UPI001F4CE92D|nr:hypothetical protein [Bartonella krasnovii]UNF51719.1 hypothetical protein MNL02_06570 [Bartonella krasnovii]